MFLSVRGLAPTGGFGGEASMKIGPSDRKGNYAACVKINMPNAGSLPYGKETTTLVQDRQSDLIKVQHLRRIALDNGLIYGIVTFTYTIARNRIPNAPERSQTRSLARRRIFQSPVPGRDRPALCQRQLFRPQGSGPSQVRDAAPSAE